jgi:ATP-dependent DNA helicase RecG
VGLLHGALASADKEEVLRAFARGALDVLVATTVIELGIDVPNATVMVVEEADRFGLAQLHQLRGRVGRGAAPGICFLCASEAAPPEEDAEDDDVPSDGLGRLDELARTADGFRLAEADLARRGFGDLFGTRQAGAPQVGPGDPRELFELVAVARREAEALLDRDPDLGAPAHQALARAARARLAGRPLYGEEAG